MRRSCRRHYGQVKPCRDKVEPPCQDLRLSGTRDMTRGIGSRVGVVSGETIRQPARGGMEWSESCNSERNVVRRKAAPPSDPCINTINQQLQSSSPSPTICSPHARNGPFSNRAVDNISKRAACCRLPPRLVIVRSRLRSLAVPPTSASRFMPLRKPLRAQPHYMLILRRGMA